MYADESRVRFEIIYAVPETTSELWKILNCAEKFNQRSTFQLYFVLPEKLIKFYHVASLHKHSYLVDAYFKKTNQ